MVRIFQIISVTNENENFIICFLSVEENVKESQGCFYAFDIWQISIENEYTSVDWIDLV